MGLLQRPSSRRPLIAALTYPRRMKYIKSRKQRAGRNATAMTSRAPPPRAHLRAVLAAAGWGRPGTAGPGAAGPGLQPPRAGTRCRPPGLAADRASSLPEVTGGGKRGRGAGGGATQFSRLLSFRAPPPRSEISNVYFWAFKN